MKNAILLLCLLPLQQVSAQVNDDLKEKYHLFDFWIGHWDVYKFGSDTLVGDSHIESIIDGFGLLENYQAERSPYAGKSLNKYNPAKEQWEQYWIDNSGLTLFLSGGISEGKMVLSDLEGGDPEKGFNKITWEKLDDQKVRQSWSISYDQGKTWSPVFDGEYRRKPREK